MRSAVGFSEWVLLFPLRLLLFLTCVNVRMLLHIGFLVEPLPAVLTGVWPRVRVDEEVRGKGGGAFERLAAHFAFEAFFLFKYTKTKIVFDCIIYVKMLSHMEQPAPGSGRSCVAPD